MKKLLSILLLFITFVFVMSCNNVKTQENSVIITAEKGEISLLDYMAELQSKKSMSFIIKDGMITEINNIKPSMPNEYWMLYTDDIEFSNNAWGEYEYNGKIYGSSTLGAQELQIKKDYTYIWVLQSF